MLGMRRQIYFRQLIILIHTRTHTHTHTHTHSHALITHAHLHEYAQTHTHTCDVVLFEAFFFKRPLYNLQLQFRKRERKKDNQTNFTQYSRSSFKKNLVEKKKCFLLLRARSDLSQVKQNRRGILYPCSEKKKKNLRKFFLSNLSKNIFYDCWKWKEKKVNFSNLEDWLGRLY